MSNQHDKDKSINMVKLPDTVKEAIAKQDVFPVATSDAQGMPNVIYIKYLKVMDDNTVLIADNYFHKTRNNIRMNPKLSFVVLDKDHGSFQIKGTAKRSIDGPMYGEVQEWVPGKLPREAAVVLSVEQVYNGAKQLA